MKSKIKRCAALFLAAVLSISMLSSAGALESGEEIYINSAEDFLALAEYCAMDSWSRGKTVILNRDISLSSTDYTPIPTFGGIFDGGGHTITGLDLSGSLSPAGLFGELQEGAVVKNLHVSGTVEPAGKGDQTGGIAGCNRGLIENCVFSGTVIGGNSVGAIAGVNESTGKIRDCTSAGAISGKSMTGGIAGNNRGVIASCQNEGYVNITSVDPGIDLTDLDVSLSSEFLTLRAMDTFHVATDTGGVAGYSSGMVLSCTNTGIVGYPRIGYNVGGIAGRSCGFISGCTNRGQVFGRKDIGGIVGQAEPYIVLNLTEDKLQRIQDELDRLGTLIDQATYDVENTSDDMHDRFSDIGECANDASRYLRRLKDLVSDYGDSVITEIDRGSDIIADVLDRLADIAEDAPAFSDEITKGLNQLEDAIDKLAGVNGFTEEALKELRFAGDDLSKAAELIDLGTAQIVSGLDELNRVVTIEGEDAVQAALDEIKAGTDALNTAMGRVSEAMDRLSEAMRGLGGIVENADWGNAGEALTALIEAAEELSAAASDAAAAFETIGQGLAVIQDNVELDIEHLKPGINMIMQGISTLGSVSGATENAIAHVQKALAQGELASGQLRTALEAFGDAVEIFSGASAIGTDMLRKVEELFDYLSAVEPIRIAHPDEEIDASANALLDSLDQIRSHMGALNDTANAATGTLAYDIRAVSSQFDRVMDAVIDAIYEAETSTAEDRFSDTSETNIDAVTNGKILSCSNEAAISGDISVGGVAGTMAVEYELDPEGDLLSDSPVYRREYEFKVILQSCVNNGAVTGRRDYAGGLCGRTDLGLIIGCRSYGTVESESGDYVGGIAGLVSGTVRDSWVKCALRGGKYVGGVAGFVSESGTALQCRSLVRVSGYEQYAGAVAGASDGTLSDNLFVADDLAGVNLISTAGKAEPVTYEEFIQIEDLPAQFRRFSLRFWAGDEAVKEITFHYGDSFDDSVFPAIPAREGQFARWDTDDLRDLHFDTDVTAVYTQYISALETENKRDNGRSVFFAEGLFSEGDSISAELLTTQDSGTENLPGISGGGRRTLLERWRLEIPEDGQESHTVRYLSPNGENEKIEVYILKNGAWQALDTATFGSYLMFEVDGLTPEIAVVSRMSAWWIWLGAGILALILAILVLSLIKKHRRKRAETENAAQGSGTVPLPAQGRELTAAKQKKKKRTKRILILAGVLAAAAGAAAVGYSVSGMRDSVTAYRLLQKSWNQDGLSMELTVQMDSGEKQMNLLSQLVRTKINGQPVICARQYGSGIYYSNGLIYLENGCVFAAPESLPNYPALLDSIEILYKDADISVFKNGNGNIYSITLSDDGVSEFLSGLLPLPEPQTDKLKDLYVDLVERDGKLSALHFSAQIAPDGDDEPITVSVALQVLDKVERPDVPEVIQEAIIKGEPKEDAVSAEELLRLLTAWLRLNAREPLSAQLSLNANCGPLILNDTLELYRTTADGLQVTCIRKNDRSVFISGDGACNEDGGGLLDEEEKLISTGELLEIVYRICMSGEMSFASQDDRHTYTLDLNEEEMAQVVYAVLPDARKLGVTLDRGDIKVIVEDDSVRSISFNCDGTVQILFVDAPMSLDGEFRFDVPDLERTFRVPEEVLQALKRRKAL